MSSVSTSTSGSSGLTSTVTHSSSSLNRSGLSVDDVVTAKLVPYLARADAVQTEINTNQAKISAYQTMASMLQGMESLVNTLSNPNSSSANVFNNRTASLSSSSSTTTASSVLSATIASGTQTGNHTVVVTQAATTQRLTSGSTVSSRTASLFAAAGSITLGETGVAGKSSVTLSVDSTTTLNSLVSTINASSATTGVTAQVVTVASGQYQLMLSGSDDNAQIGLSDTNGALSTLGLSATKTSSVTDPGGTGAGVALGLSTAGNALTINGQSVTINSTDTLGQIAQDITNAGANVTATVNGDQLVITNNSGNTSDIDFTGSSGTILSQLGLGGATSSSLATSSTSLTTTSVSAVASANLGIADGSTLTINGTTVTINSGSNNNTLNSVAAAINSQLGGAGITASVRSGMLQLYSSSGSTSFTVSDSTGGSVMSALGLSANGNNFSGGGTVLQQAQAAILTVDGLTVTRDSNSVDDVLDGITLDITKAAPSTTITLGIQVDTTTIESTITAMTSAYNSWRSFYQAETSLKSDGSAASSSAVLFGDSALRSADTAIQTAISSLVLGSSLGAIGLSLDSSNQLQVDSGVLESALQYNLSSVENLFQYTASVTDNTGQTSSAIQLVTHGTTNVLNGSYSDYAGTLSLTFDISAAGTLSNLSGTISPASLSGQTNVASNFYTNGTQIVGSAASTDFYGLALNYTGGVPNNGAGGTVTYNVVLTQGIADLLYQTAYNMADSKSNASTLSSLISSLQTQDSSLTITYNSLQSQASSYKNYLLDQYGSFEASISQADQTASLMQTLMAYDTKG